ncbi:pilus assembly protein [Pseudoalteromonas phenolica]|uniref:Type II secretion system protein H n=1 Tax=Pseudoalteromonas phenolica TaxID=161398 RepID=A0A5S3YR25_9GAMM|nr:GspH/FimT family pseudopilin [Pseudoalteromonas phenolica]TMN87420.1 pilus assembly protein [Pseudoalteromonas phenolica]TMP79323.1 pilus assembly protein [Pseudoalteromonas phenolica]
MAAKSTPNYTRGLTLIELLITLSLIVILSLLAVPSFNSVLHKNRPEVALKQIKRQIFLSRSYAITHDKYISICGLVHNKCHKDLWHESLTSFVDTNRNHVLDADEQVLYVIDRINIKDELSYPRHAITFKPDGSLKGLANGTFVYCSFDYEGKPIGLEMSINNAGRARLRDTKRCKKRI